MAISKDLGPVSGYAVAVEHGFTGTEEEWIQLVLKGTENAQTADTKAAEALASATDAAKSARAAADNANTAGTHQTKAGQSATAAAKSAQRAAASESNAANSASTAAASAAEAQRVERSIPNDYTTLERTQMLHTNEVNNTVQSIVFDNAGNVQFIMHIRAGEPIRTDAFIFDTSTITETRTLATGETLTITTDLATLETTVAYATS